MSVTIETGATDTSNATVLYQNIFEDGTVTTNSETSDGAALNAVEDTTFDFWTPAGVPAYVRVDYGSAVECDCAGIASHDAGTQGTTLEVQYSTDDASWTTVSTISPLTDETILVVFPAVEARYWRVRQSSAVCSIGVVKLGKRLVFPSGVLNGHTAVNHSNRVELLTPNVSQNGQFLGSRIRRIGARVNINFGQLETSFVDNDMLVFEGHFNSGRSFFYAGSPSEWPEDYGYCWRGGSEIRPNYEEGGLLSQVDIEADFYVEQ